VFRLIPFIDRSHERLSRRRLVAMALAGVVMIGVIGLTIVWAISSPAGIATVPPVAGMSAQQIEGLKIYNAEGCSSCHALREIGETSGPDLSRAGFRWEADAIRAQIVTPKDAGMPAFDRLTTQQIDDLVSFLTSLK
jgi:Cbb3-type cytochrome oxidase, cytochrome c subunit